LKKPDIDQEERIRARKERKRLIRLRKDKHYQGDSSTYTKESQFLIKYDRKIIEKWNFSLLEFFKEKRFTIIQTSKSKSLNVPPKFSFREDYSLATNFINDVINSYLTFSGDKITIDFSNCSFVDQAALFVLVVINIEFRNELSKLSQKLRRLSQEIEIEIIKSSNDTVNKRLFLTGLLKEIELKNEGLMPINTFGYHKVVKPKKTYSENKKGQIGTNTVSYLNECLSHHNYVILKEGQNYLDGIISEILNNAEDHSTFNTYYVTANFSSNKTHNKEDLKVGEINLSFMNFGNSIFEGFESTKDLNKVHYTLLDDKYSTLKKKYPFNKISKELIFSLYALQEGVSRLKYDDKSRGTGTIKFIKSFFDIGD